jgi:hypothetical protein
VIQSAEADRAFLEFLKEVSSCSDDFRTIANNVASLGQSSPLSSSERANCLTLSVQCVASTDCLLSLALTATQPGFTKPEFTEEHQLTVESGLSFPLPLPLRLPSIRVKTCLFLNLYPSDYDRLPSHGLRSQG